MIFQCHDQNTKPCLRQTAPQQPRDIFLSVQDGRSRVVDVASTGALKPYYPYSVEAKWDQGGINALSASRLLLNFYWVGIDSAGSIRIHHLHSTSIDILWSNRLTLDFVLSPVLQLKSWFPRWRAFTSRYFTRCWNLLYNRTWVVARLEALEKSPCVVAQPFLWARPMGKTWQNGSPSHFLGHFSPTRPQKLNWITPNLRMQKREMEDFLRSKITKQLIFLAINFGPSINWWCINEKVTSCRFQV